MKNLTILLIETNRLLRDGVAAVINEQPGLMVVKTLGSESDMLRHARRLKPDVVLIDLGLRNNRTLRAVVELIRELPRVKVIGMGLLPSQEDIVGFVQAGAAGFILKNATVDDVLRTICSVVRGEIVRPPSLTGSLLTYVADRAFQKTNGKMPPAVRMTKRERAIAISVAGGASNQEIAMELGLSAYAVRSHINNILEKMALRSRFQISEQLRSARRA